MAERFTSWDGSELYYRHWQAAKPTGKALILLHRGHEHCERLGQLVHELNLQEFDAFAFDLRGHGRSPGRRGFAPSFDCHVRDLESFSRYITAEYGFDMSDCALIANSVGGVVASAWVHDYAPKIRCQVLAAPALRIKLYVPLAVPGLRLLQRLSPESKISSYVKSKMLTHDAEQANSYDEDPLITRDISVNILLGLHDSATRLMDDAAAIHTPTLLLAAGSDHVVKESAQRTFFERLSSVDKEMHLLPGFFHAIFYEKQRELAYAPTRRFIRRQFEQPSRDVNLLDSDVRGFTFDEYQRLLQPAHWLKQLFFSAQIKAMSTIGRMSDGIDLGETRGYDSGASLDYIYRNQVQGRNVLGRWFDRIYLSAIGWRGIRQRKVNLRRAIDDAIETVSAQDKPVRILDVASGPGRYLLEVLKDHQDCDIKAYLRDFLPANVEAGRALALELGVEAADYQEHDAFDSASFENLPEQPNIVIVSGLYELFPSNAMVSRSLAAIRGAMAPDGLLIYTGQPWHPQIEMIARTLRNRNGEPWVMRRRTQGEMDQLVESSGLRKVASLIGPYGIFTVSTARNGMEP
jgi:alpha-beta hydrolase superfamily lysophospholipase/SAM-dependent methyltransferase